MRTATSPSPTFHRGLINSSGGIRPSTISSASRASRSRQGAAQSILEKSWRSAGLEHCREKFLLIQTKRDSLMLARVVFRPYPSTSGSETEGSTREPRQSPVENTNSARYFLSSNGWLQRWDLPIT